MSRTIASLFGQSPRAVKADALVRWRVRGGRTRMVGLSLGLLGLGGLGCGARSLNQADTDANTDASSSESTSESSSESDSTESESTTESTESDSTDTDAFVPDFDLPELNQCEPWGRDCREGEKCVPYSSDGSNWDAHKCVAVMGDQVAGEPCVYGGVVEATDDCDASSACWNVADIDGEAIGTCLLFCTGTADNPECPLGSSCLLSGSFSAALCQPQCDPILQDCGIAGLGCYWAVADFQCVFTTENIPTGEPCGFINDCAPGNVCTEAASLPSCAGESCCAAFCDLTQGDVGCAATPGTACVPFYMIGMAPPGNEDVGHCVLP